MTDLRQFFLGFGEFLPGRDSLRLNKALFNEFRLPRLDREIGLRERYLFLFGIAILGDEIARIARKHDIVDPAPAARAEVDGDHDIGAKRTRFGDLVWVEHEVLAQDRQAGGVMGDLQIFIRTLKIWDVSQH